MNAATLAMAGLCVCSTVTYAQPGTPLWTNRYNGPGNGNDVATAIAVDSHGYVYVAGSSTGSGGSYDYATIKYSSGGEALWTNRYNGLANDNAATALAVDGSGNVYVTGESFFGTVVTSDYATVAYSSDGVGLWTNRYIGPGNGPDSPLALAVDSGGNLFVTGYSATTNAYPFNYDYLTIKYSSGGLALWTNRYNGPGNGDDAAFALAVDGSGSVAVAGYSYGTNGYPDYATIKYSRGGVPLWTNRYNASGNGAAYANALALDNSGNVYLAGQAWNGSSVDYATIAYSSAGVALWTNRYDGPGNDTDLATAIAVDSSGNVYVAGSSTGSGSSYDYATIKYSNAGVAMWTNRYDGPGNFVDRVYAIALDNSGNAYVTGQSVGSDSSYDYATIAYSSAGVALWTNRYNGPGNSEDYGNAIAVDSSGNVYVTGGSASINSVPYNYDYATIKYSGPGLSPIPLKYQIVSEEIVLSWTNAAFDLQSAPAVLGAYTNIPGATSPYTNVISSNQQYFRLRGY